MKFTRYGHHEPVTPTSRKAAAFARKQTKELDRYALFADHVAAEQHDLDEEFRRRNLRIASSEARMRNFHARCWRSTRARYFALPPETRAEIQASWKVWTGPRTSTYFAWMVDTISGDQAARLATIEEAWETRRASVPEFLSATTAPLF